jgi:hypothetical protein
MSKQTFSGSITLSKLKSVITERKGKSGDMVKGIFIPFDVNFLTVKENSVYMDVNIHVNEQPDKYDQDGFISHRAPSALYKAATDAQKEEMKKLPILGNFRDFSGNTSNDSTSSVDADSDVPF